MIQKISSILSVKSNYRNNKDTSKSNVNNNSQNPIQAKSVNSALLSSYYVSFKGTPAGKSDKKAQEDAEIAKQKRVLIESKYTAEAKELLDNSTKIAKKYKHAEVNQLHIEMAALISFKEYLNGLEAGTETVDSDSSYKTPDMFVDKDTLKNKKQRSRMIPVIDKELENLDVKLKKIPQTRSSQKPLLVQKISDNIYSRALADSADNQQQMIAPITDEEILEAVDTLERKEEKNVFRQFSRRLCETVMTDSRDLNEKIHIRFFDDRAKNILTNLSHGTNMFVVYEKTANPIYLVDSIVDVLKNQKTDFGTINEKNTDITVFNKDITEDFLQYKIKQCAKDKKNHILIVNMDDLENDINGFVVPEEGEFITEDLSDVLKDQPKNVKVVFLREKDNYYKMMSDNDIQKLFENFSNTSLPLLNPEQNVEAFTKQPLLMQKIGKKCSPQAISLMTDEVRLAEGAYPDKVLKLAKDMATYYADSDEISGTMAVKYLEETRSSRKIAGENGALDITFDTGTRLKDIIGKDATVKEADTYVKRIKSKTLGTKGALIYSQDGSVGSGRAFVAKVIANETKSPFIEINAMDFGDEGVNLFGKGSPVFVNDGIKQLGHFVANQAETSPYKSAVLYIKNFDLLPHGDEYKNYKSALAQLEREIEKFKKKGLQVLVLGSVNDFDTAESCSDELKYFGDKFEIESPARNPKARTEILSNFLKKEKIQLAGNTEEIKETTKLMSETTDRFTLIKLVGLVDKIKAVMIERGHKLADKKDVTEAYLQLTTGRISSEEVSEPLKKELASHEWGHGFNLWYMRRWAEKQNRPYILGDKVNFITLDPRSWYYGAVEPKYGGNEISSMEKLVADEVCYYGGYSAEKHFYNIDGSYGISADMEYVTEDVENAIGEMGQGRDFGRKSVLGMHYEMSQKQLETFEKDRDIRLKNDEIMSDLIVKFGETHGQEFNEKYSSRVGTGDCIILSDEFESGIDNWMTKQKQSKNGKKFIKEMEELDKAIYDVIESTKQGKIFDVNGKNVSKVIKELWQKTAHNLKR